jgi:hypothetical protein
MTKKAYWVWWTYSANYGGPKRVEANDAAHAVQVAVGFYSDDFRTKGTAYVSTERPEVFQGDLLVRACKEGA